MSHVTRNSSNASSTSALHERGSPSGPPDPEAPRLGWWEIAPATSPSSRLRFGRVFEFEGDSKSSITIIGRNPISTSTCGQVSSGTGVQHPCSCFAQVHRVVPLRVNNNDFSPSHGRIPPRHLAQGKASTGAYTPAVTRPERRQHGMRQRGTPVDTSGMHRKISVYVLHENRYYLNMSYVRFPEAGFSYFGDG